MQEKELYSDGIDTKKFFQVVCQHKAIVIAIILCCTAIAAVYAFVKPVEYHSEAIICLRNPGPTGMEENFQAIMMLKKNPEFNGLELNFVRDTGTIKIEATKNNAQEAHDAVQKGVNQVQQDINVQNQLKEQEEYPSLLKAKEEMNKARQDLEAAKIAYPEASSEVQQLKDEYTARLKVYESQLNARLRSLYAVQVLNDPNLPERPENTKRGKDVLIGFFIGCLISFYYCMKQYKKKG